VAWDAVAAGWERRAALFRDATRELTERLVALLAPKPGEVVLELAAGIGDTGFLAAGPLGPDGLLLSTDAAPEMLAAAQRRAAELELDNVEFRQVDATSIDLGNESVDGVLCRFGIMLLDDPGRALSEIARVLRPGGRVALAVWASPDENEWMTATGRAALELGLTEPPDPLAPGPFRLSDAGELTDLVTAAGLHVAALEDVTVRWRVMSCDEWWEAIRDTSPTLEALVEGLSSGQAQALRTAAERRLERHVAPDGSLEVPGVARALLAVKDGER
jgi:SAM-dependent methyltransferase